MRSLIFTLFLLGASSAYSHTITINYSPAIEVSGDEEEFDDWLGGDDYSNFSVDAEDATTLKFSYELKETQELDGPKNDDAALIIYTDYSVSDFKYKDGDIEKGKYQSLTSGMSVLVDKELNNYFSSYFSMGFGLGISRFKLSSNKDRAVGELFIEGGFSVYKSFYLGIGGKYQVIGYPSETIATVSNLYIGLGVRF
jgi:hypothetical protein